MLHLMKWIPRQVLRNTWLHFLQVPVQPARSVFPIAQRQNVDFYADILCSVHVLTISMDIYVSMVTR